MMRTAIDSGKIPPVSLLAGLLTPILLWGWESDLFRRRVFAGELLFWISTRLGLAQRGLRYRDWVVLSGAMLAWQVHKARKSIPFSAVFLAFGVFIVASGLTHLIEAWTLWQPRYWLASE